MDTDTHIIERIKDKFGSKVLESHDFRGDQTVTIDKECIVEVAKFLRDDKELCFNFLMDITAVDYMDKKPKRFEMVYHFYSLKNNNRVRVKAPVSEEECRN